ncbi:MAG TPA: hypothetical protein VF736_19120 [Pyrinomonadaceae bacterium]|jgi:hypothetical protein
MRAVDDERGMAEVEPDARVRYPCYKSLDEFIDVERLKSLDGRVAEAIRRHISRRKEDYFLNLHRLDSAAPETPGSREVWLTRTKPGVPYNYLDLDKPGLWRPTPEAGEFPELMDFIGTLPFAETGRMLVIYDDAATEVPAHRDHLHADICHEFIWFRTNLRKPFYVLNHGTGEKLYVSSYSAWFDTVNQFHGSDPGEGLSFSIRVDGRFTDEFRRLIPKPAFNPASAPALWACGAEA